MTSRFSRPLRSVFAAACVAGAVVMLSGCAQLDSLTGDQSVKWSGTQALPTASVTAAEYREVPLLPRLTAPKAAMVFGHRAPARATAAEAAGPGWGVQVQQGQYATAVRYGRACAHVIDTAHSAAAVATAKRTLGRLGGDPGTWAWFVVPDPHGAVRVIAEPKINGVQTWATGSIAAVVDGSGVCGWNALLDGFTKTGKQVPLPSAYSTFQSARHAGRAPASGDYRQAQQTWTLTSKGLVEPLWWFRTATSGMVAVNLGDGLETAPDTKTLLLKSAAQHPITSTTTSQTATQRH